MKEMLKELNKFIEGTTNTTDVFSITDESLGRSSGADVAAIRNKLDLCHMNGLINMDHVPGALLITMTEKAINRGPQTGLEGDARVQPVDDSDPNPFRPRYRKLTQEEAELHDAIKNKAYELWLLFDKAIDIKKPGIDFMSPDWTTSPNGVAWIKAVRERALARTALEDAVVRAVKALTA
jgi:hypothetical protein